MTNTYVVPAAGDPDELAAVVSKAGVKMIAPESVRELIMQTVGENTVVAMVRPQELLLVKNHANTLVEELPTMVMAVPGLLYTHEWSGIAAVFPSIDWLELKNKLSKAGSTAFSPDVMTKRHGTLVQQTRITPLSEEADLPGEEL